MRKERKQLRIFEFEQQLEFLKGGPKAVQDILEAWDAVMHYAYIVHDKDDAPPHAHFLVRLQGNRDLSTIANRLQTEEQYIQKIQTTFDQALCYLTHKTPKAQVEGKYQYGDDEVVANFAWTMGRDKKLQSISDRIKDEEYLQMVALGLIKPYEISEQIPLESRLRLGRQRLSYAMEIYMDSLKGNRNMAVIFISGDTGTGKTTLAKRLCEDRGLPYFISGTGSDWLDGYQCEPAVILDDVRSCDWKCSEWLKLTDNHTSSKIWSRYKSKAMAACELLIITTTLPLHDFMYGFQGIGSEDVRQVRRRLSEVITLSYDSMTSDKGFGVQKYRYSLPALLRGDEYFTQKAPDDTGP